MNCPYCNAPLQSYFSKTQDRTWDCGTTKYSNQFRQSWHCLKAQVVRLQNERDELKKELQKLSQTDLQTYMEYRQEVESMKALIEANQQEVAQLKQLVPFKS